MSEPQEGPALTPLAPKRKPTLFERLLARLPKMHSAPPVQQMFACTHRYADGSSAWSACWWNGSYWQSTCRRCGLVARCR